MSRYRLLLVSLSLAGLLAGTTAPLHAATVPVGGQGSSSWCGTWDWGIEVSLARHELQTRRLAGRFRVQSLASSAATQSRAINVGSQGRVALLEDQGTVVIDRNPFDYDNRGVKFIRKGKNGYKVKKLGGSVNSTLGDKLNLGDDDAVRVPLSSFRIRYFGKNYDSLYVNSDGNITFGKSDTASTARDLRRLLSGPPRIAPLFADLDPSRAIDDGGVYVRLDADRVTITWWQVPNFDEFNLNTFEVRINARGNAEFRYGKIDSAEAVVGLAPGGGSGLELIDLTSDLPLKRKGIAIAERFSQSLSVDEAAVAQVVLQNFGDNYDQLVLFSDFAYMLDDTPGTIAYHMTVNNQVRGIGRATFNAARFYGSQGRLGGFINMGHLSKYPNNLDKDSFIDDLYAAIDILAHEIGHQWLVGARFVDASGQVSDDLLGRSGVHWSYYFNSDLSFLEGNRIQDNGGGSFTTQRGAPTYNDLDLYFMGLLPAGQVSDFWYVRASAPQDTDTAAPEGGATFQGTRVDLEIDDVIAALGPRRPTSQDAPKEFRIGFVLLTRDGKKASDSSINKVNQFAVEIEKVFARETRRLGRLQAGI